MNSPTQKVSFRNRKDLLEWLNEFILAYEDIHKPYNYWDLDIHMSHDYEYGYVVTIPTKSEK